MLADRHRSPFSDSVRLAVRGGSITNNSASALSGLFSKAVRVVELSDCVIEAQVRYAAH